jgi:transposase
MVNFSSALPVYFATGATDIRKSIDGLAALVQASMGLDPFSPALFVFCNRKRDKLKILHFERNGFWLYYRRLEQGVFRWPAGGSSEPLVLSSRELQWLLDGLSIAQPQAHQAISLETAL